MNLWQIINKVQWKTEAKKEYLARDNFLALLDHMYKTGHLAETFNSREEWSQSGIFSHEIRGYWEHLYIGGETGVRHILSHRFDDSLNKAAAEKGFVPDVGKRANAIEQRLFKSFNGVTERQAFGYSDPALNKCVPRQLYYINHQWINKKIYCAGKADFSSHYPANICGPLPNWSKRQIKEGTYDPTPEYPFVFYTRSGHLAEYKRFDTHAWRNEDLTGNLFGKNYTCVKEDNDISVLCPPSLYTLDTVIEYLYNKKNAGEMIESMPAKDILNVSIGYKHLNNPFNTVNRLYHLAAVCIARANQKMLDLYNSNPRMVLQIIVDGIIYIGAHEIGNQNKELGKLRQEITDQTFIMRGINQYMFFDRRSGNCTDYSHSGFDYNILTQKPEDIFKWQRATKE